MKIWRERKDKPNDKNTFVHYKSFLSITRKADYKVSLIVITGVIFMAWSLRSVSATRTAPVIPELESVLSQPLTLHYTVPAETETGDAIFAELPLEVNLRRLGLIHAWDGFSIYVESLLDGNWEGVSSAPVYAAHSPALNTLCTGWYAVEGASRYRIILEYKKEPVVRARGAASGLFEPLYARNTRVDVSFLSTPVLADINGDGNQDIITGAADDSRLLYVMQGLSGNRWLPARPVAQATEPPSMARPGSFTRLGSDLIYDIPVGTIGLRTWGRKNYIFKVTPTGVSVPVKKHIKWQSESRLWCGNTRATLGTTGHDLYWTLPDGSLHPLLFTNGTPFRSNSSIRPDWDLLHETTNQTTLIVGAHDGSFRRVQVETRPENEQLPEIADADLLRTEEGPLSAGSIVVPTVGDLNGDGREDLLVGEEYGTVLVYFQDPSAETITFIEQGHLDIGGELLRFSGAGKQNNDEFWGYAQPLLVDMDGDGLLDLQLSRSDGCQYWSRNQGTPETYCFGPEKQLHVDGEPLQTGWRVRLALYDWDDDGKMDILGSNNDGHLFWCRGLDTPGSFGTERLLRNAENKGLFFSSHDSWGYGRDKFLVTDWNEDGVRDLVHARTLGRILVHFGVKNDPDLIGPPQAIELFGRTLWIGSGHTLSPTVCDLDHDGREDWIIGTESGRVRFLSYAALHRGRRAELTGMVTQDGENHVPQEWLDSRYDCDPLAVEVTFLLPHRLPDRSGGGGSYELIWQLYRDPFQRWFDFATNGVDAIGSESQLSEFITANGAGQVLVPGYHTFNNNAWLREWFSEHSKEIQRWVASGGVLIASAGRDKTEEVLWKQLASLNPDGIVQEFPVEKSILVNGIKLTIDSRDPTFVQHDLNFPDDFKCDVLARSLRGNPVVVRIPYGEGAFVFYTPELIHQDHTARDGAYGWANPILRNLWRQMMGNK